MANNPNFKTILLTKEQIAVLEKIRQAEHRNSPLGLSPSLHAIARRIMDSALEAYA